MTRTGLCGPDLTCYSSDMNRRILTETVAENVSTAIAAADQPNHIVAQAADMDSAVFEEALTGKTPFTISQLLRVGGFLRVPAHQLMKEATP